MDIKKLRHAIALANEGNFARAAEKIHLTQSALSRSIQSLEQDLDLKIFERRSNGVRPTITGLKFLDSATDLIRRADSLTLLARLLKGAEIGDIAFGVGPVPAYLLLPRVLTQLSIEHPNLKITAEVQSAIRLMTWLIDEKIEFFVANIAQFTPSTDIYYEPLLTLSSGLYVRGGHPLLNIKSTIKDLQQYPFASPGFADTTQRSKSPYAKPNLIDHIVSSWESRINCEDVNTLTSVTLASDAVMMMSAPCIETYLNEGKLHPLTIDGQQLQWPSQLSVVYLKGRLLSPAAKKVVALMKAFGESSNGQTQV